MPIWRTIHFSLLSILLKNFLVWAFIINCCLLILLLHCDKFTSWHLTRITQTMPLFSRNLSTSVTLPLSVLCSPWKIRENLCSLFQSRCHSCSLLLPPSTCHLDQPLSTLRLTVSLLLALHLLLTNSPALSGEVASHHHLCITLLLSYPSASSCHPSSCSPHPVVLTLKAWERREDLTAL